MLIKYLMSKYSFLRLFPAIREIVSKQGVVHFRRRKIFSFRDRFVCFHEFFQPDKDYLEHDHPRDFICMNLVGGYSEIHKGQLKFVPILQPRFLRAEYSHRIVSLTNGVYSLSISISGPQKREWGYVDYDYSSPRWLSQQEYKQYKQNRSNSPNKS